MKEAETNVPRCPQCQRPQASGWNLCPDCAVDKQAYAGVLERLLYLPVPVPNPLTGELCYANPDGSEAAEAISSLLKALESVPIPGRNEPMPAFYERMNDWLNTTYRAALSGEKL